MKKNVSFKYSAKHISSIKKSEDGSPSLKEDIPQIIKVIDNILLVNVGGHPTPRTTDELPKSTSSCETPSTHQVRYTRTQSHPPLTDMLPQNFEQP